MGTILLLTEKDIRKVCSMKDIINANERAYKMFSEGRTEVPLRPVIHDEDKNSDFIFMPAYAPDLEAAGIKIVTTFPENAKSGDAVTKGQVILIDGKNGDFLSVMDGTFVTAFRTGAASGAAFDVLGCRNPRIGALIGTGGQARCQLEAMLSVADLDEVRVAARNFQKTKKFAEDMSSLFKNCSAKIVPCETGDEAVKDADLIITVTPSPVPVFSAENVKKGATISAVGSYRDDMNELDPALFGIASKIYFDSTEACVEESGDVHRPLEQGIITENDFTGELGQVILGQVPGRESEDEIILFKNVGIGILDLVAAESIYRKARENKAGTKWNE